MKKDDWKNDDENGSQMIDSLWLMLIWVVCVCQVFLRRILCLCHWLSICERMGVDRWGRGGGLLVYGR